MSNVVALQSRSKGAALVEQYSHLLSFERVERVPLEHLPTLLEAIDASLRPAAPVDVAKAVGVLVTSFKIPDNLEDRSAFTRLMKNDLAVYPFDILDEAIKRARRMFKWLPSIAEMIEICDELVGSRVSQRRAVGWILSRRQLDEEHEREKTERADRSRRLREEQSARIRALHGDAAAVTPEEIEIAGYFRPIIHRPSGEMFAWHESLDRGELWAARHCRRLALVARAQRCEDGVLIRRENTVALAKLVIADETAARRQVEDMEAGKVKDRLPLPESPDPLWSAIVAIETAAWGERGVFPEGELSAPPPLVQNECFGPPPDATLDLAEDPQKAAGELKRAKEVIEGRGGSVDGR